MEEKEKHPLYDDAVEFLKGKETVSCSDKFMLLAEREFTSHLQDENKLLQEKQDEAVRQIKNFFDEEVGICEDRTKDCVKNKEYGGLYRWDIKKEVLVSMKTSVLAFLSEGKVMPHPEEIIKRLLAERTIIVAGLNASHTSISKCEQLNMALKTTDASIIELNRQLSIVNIGNHD